MEPASFESSISLNFNFSESGNLPVRVGRIRSVQSDLTIHRKTSTGAEMVQNNRTFSYAPILHCVGPDVAYIQLMDELHGAP